MHSSQSILVVEDDRVDAMVVKRALKQCFGDIQIVHVIDGVEALEYLRSEQNQAVSVILLDLHAPRMNGTDFLKDIKDDVVLKDIPIVILSGSDDKETMDEVFELGALDYIIKSTEYAEFSKSISSIERFWKDEIESSVRG